MNENLNNWLKETDQYKINKRQVSKKAQENYEFIFAVLSRIENEFTRKELCRRFDRLIEELMEGGELGTEELTPKKFKQVQEKAKQLSLF